MTDFPGAGVVNEILAIGIRHVPYAGAVLPAPSGSLVSDDFPQSYWRMFLRAFSELPLDVQLRIINDRIIHVPEVWNTDPESKHRWDVFYNPLLCDILQLCTYEQGSPYGHIVRKLLLEPADVPQDKDLWYGVFHVMGKFRPVQTGPAEVPAAA